MAMIKPTVSAEIQFRFLELPLEIRDMVYTYSLDAKGRYFVAKQLCHKGICLHGISLSQRFQPSLLLTCKQVEKEYLALTYRKIHLEVLFEFSSKLTSYHFPLLSYWDALPQHVLNRIHTATFYFDIATLNLPVVPLGGLEDTITAISSLRKIEMGVMYDAEARYEVGHRRMFPDASEYFKVMSAMLKVFELERSTMASFRIPNIQIRSYIRCLEYQCNDRLVDPALGEEAYLAECDRYDGPEVYFRARKCNGPNSWYGLQADPEMRYFDSSSDDVTLPAA